MVGRPQGHPPRFQTVLQKKKSATRALFLLCGTCLGRKGPGLIPPEATSRYARRLSQRVQTRE